MKKSLILTLLFGFFSVGWAQPNISNVSFPSAVNLFDLFEISYISNTYSNPYDPDEIDMYAEFTAPNGRIYRVNGFYFEGYRFEKHNGYEKAYADKNNKGWRIRFTPNQVGKWRFAIHAKDKKGEISLSTYKSLDFIFVCNQVDTANGFISQANSQYLKREIVKDGQRQNHSFFPVGPNVAWYTCMSYYNYKTPKGIYDYEAYINSLTGNANYMRIWLSRYQYLSLYGIEYALGDSIVYFNSTLNQKDAAELDYIVHYATQHGITLMPCIFTFGDFTRKGTESKGPGKWSNNPFHTELGLRKPYQFFTDRKAKRITRNLIRYVVARWGYSPQIMAWELWNEVSNMDIDISTKKFQRKVTKWHNEMADYIRSIDPFGHLITTSMGGVKDNRGLYENLFKQLDIAQLHNYQNIDKARSNDQFSNKLLGFAQEGKDLYPSIPFFVGEFGFGDLSINDYKAKDPFGIDLHNSLWSSLFSGSMGPASFWYWDYLRKSDLYTTFKPVFTFCEGMAIPSASYTACTTGKSTKHALVFPNNLETYYMLNANEDTIYGWSQDTAFCYQSLRHFTEKTTKSHFQENAVVDKNGYLYTLKPDKRPVPSSTSNTITLPISEQPIGAQYMIRWYNSETGLEIDQEKAITTVKQGSKGKYISFEFPSSLRDLKNKKINNTYGDAVFMITLDKKEGSNTKSITPNDKPTIKMSRTTNQ